MMKQKMKELAAMYGIEIKDVEMGNGRLFYEDSNGNKEALNDIFEPIILPVMNINALMDDENQ